MITFVGTVQNKKDIFLFFSQKEGNNTFLKAVKSTDGISFSDASKYAFLFDTMQKEEQAYHIHNFRTSRIDHEYFLTYKKTKEKDSPLLGAISNNLSVFNTIGQLAGITQTGAVVPEYQHNDKYVMYVGEKDIHLAESEDAYKWTLDERAVISPRADLFDHGNLEVGNAYIVDNNILLIYFAREGHGDKTKYAVGAAYFDKNNPSQVLWRSEESIYSIPEEFYTGEIEPLGTALVDDQLLLYWTIDKTTLFSVSIPLPRMSDVPRSKVFTHIVKKAHNNPILSPRPDVPWDSRASFNSAAILEDGKVHFLYRALGDTDLSVLGYATSTDGLHIDFRAEEPAYIPREPFETPGNHAFSTLAQHFVSGGGYGGIEDPRITRVDDKIYLTYVAFDGATPPRAAISHISVDDFVKNDWDKWASPKLISAPGMVNKSAVVLPRKVKGKYVVMHRVYPNILVDYLDNLEFEDYLQGHHFIPPRKRFWDSKKVGAGAPPIETKDGWLLIYQSVGYQDSGRYKIGAMMLDKDRPEKVLYRTHVPIIEPDQHYENNGFKSGVVYPCGAVILDNKLHIYYGGSDSYLCGATADMDKFLYEMKHNREPRVQMISIPRS